MSLNNAKKPLILKKMIIQPKGQLPMHCINNVSGTLNVKGNDNHNQNIHLNSQLIKLAAIPLYREDVIFESKDESYIPREYRSVTIINKLNNLTNNCKTIAKCVTLDDKTVEKTSDNLTELIGQEAYNTLFYALCSIINQEYRIKAILALLTIYKPPIYIPMADAGVKKVETVSQTDETRLDTKRRIVKKKRVRRVLAPHIVKPEDYTKKYIVDPRTGIAREQKVQEKPKINPPTETIKSEVDELNFKTEIVENELPVENSILPEISTLPENSILPDNSTLQDLGCFQDDSNDSLKSMTSIHTFQTFPGLYSNPLSLLRANIDKHTKEIPEPKFTLTLSDKSEIKLIHKPEDVFHIATKENLEFLNELDRRKLVFHQLEIDKQHCCTSRDEDGNLPIHLAVINEDVELLKRQCVVLKMMGESVDIPANNGLTALKLAIDYHTSPHSVPMLATLLQNGADSLLADAEQHSCSVHRAAELKTDHLALILHWAKERHREMIMDNEDLQKPGWQEKTQDELQNMLLEYICNLFDKQGYNPLMLACKHGNYENVKLLLEAVPASVNLQNPNSGNTALFIAVAAACNVAAEQGNKSKIVDHFKKTIEILLDYGADPQIENNNNFHVNLLLSEFGCAELSSLVLNKIASQKFFGGDMDPTKNYNKYLLLKEGKNVTIQEFKDKPKSILKNSKTPASNKPDPVCMIKITRTKKNPEKKITNNVAQDKKPVIVENILLKSPLNVKEKSSKLISILPKSQVTMEKSSKLISILPKSQVTVEKSSELISILPKSQITLKQLSSVVNIDKVNSTEFVLITPDKDSKVIPLKRKIDVSNTHGKKQKNK